MKRTLIRNAHVIAAPPTAPSPTPIDILIQDDRIADLGVDLDVDGAEVVDGAGRIVIPGLVNAHQHLWQTALRGVAYDWSLGQYLQEVHGPLAGAYTPVDIYIGTLAGALNQLDCGTTTIGDYCHNNRTTEHTDAGVAALREAGVRAVFLHGPPRPLGTHGAVLAQPRPELERLRHGPFSAGGLLTLGLAPVGPLYGPLEIAEADLHLAREFGCVASMHYSGPVSAPDAWAYLGRAGLLGPHVNLVHGNHIDDEQLKRFVDLGVTFTVTPEVEIGDGHGPPITGRLRALGARPSLGVDIESAISGEMLTVARVALVHQRGVDHAARAAGLDPSPISACEALAWATIEGARALGMDERIGSLEIGKQADLVMIDARALNLWPNNNIVAMALQASLANIEGVMIAGEWRKRNGRLLYGDLSGVQQSLADSAARITSTAGLASAVA